MDIFYNYTNFPKNCGSLALAIGTFDGVHKGHRKLIAHIVDKAHVGQMISAVLTFHPHPATLGKKSFPLLMPLEKRLETLAALGVQKTLVQELSPDFTALTPAEFFEKILLPMGVKDIAVGRDFSFGHERSGNFATLKDLAEKHNISAHLLEDITTADGLSISSTRIRSLLSAGDIKVANELLGHNYTLYGEVVPGAQRGRQLGYPTANIATHELLPLAGVYGGFLSLNNIRYLAAVHIGAPATFGATLPTVEAYLPHYSGGEFYGQKVALELTLFVRESRRFSGPAAIIAAMQDDVAYIERELKIADPSA